MLQKKRTVNGLNPESLTEGIVRTIREAITLGRWKPEEKIIEVELADQMGVSRSPIREALRILANEGLVTLVPRKGAKVSKISLKDLKEIYAIRANLESMAAKIAAVNLRNDEIKRMESLHEKMLLKTRKNDVEGIFRLNEKFHLCILKAGDNEQLIEVNKSLKIRSQRFRMAILSLPDRLVEALDEHHRILEALKGRDALLAEELVKAHIHRAGQRLIEDLEKRNREGAK
jgi:DNA-binding GntR family transcriptional regulator